MKTYNISFLSKRNIDEGEFYKALDKILTPEELDILIVDMFDDPMIVGTPNKPKLKKVRVKKPETKNLTLYKYEQKK